MNTEATQNYLFIINDAPTATNDLTTPCGWP
jgi:hypothetical protein